MMQTVMCIFGPGVTSVFSLSFIIYTLFQICLYLLLHMISKEEQKTMNDQKVVRKVNYKHSSNSSSKPGNSIQNK